MPIPPNTLETATTAATTPTATAATTPTVLPTTTATQLCNGAKTQLKTNKQTNKQTRFARRYFCGPCLDGRPTKQEGDVGLNVYLYLHHLILILSKCKMTLSPQNHTRYLFDLHNCSLPSTYSTEPITVSFLALNEMCFYTFLLPKLNDLCQRGNK